MDVPTVVSFSSLPSRTWTGGDHGGLLPNPGLAAPSAVSRDELGQRVFRTFPRSADVAGQVGARVHGHSSRRRSHVLLEPTGADVPLGGAAWHTSGLGEVSRWPLRAHRHPERAVVDRGHALIFAGATARPGRERNTGWAVEVGQAPVIMQLELFMFLDVPQIQFNYGMPHIPVVCRGVVDVHVNCSDKSSSSPSAWANSKENRRVFTGADAE